MRPRLQSRFTFQLRNAKETRPPRPPGVRGVRAHTWCSRVHGVAERPVKRCTPWRPVPCFGRVFVCVCVRFVYNVCVYRRCKGVRVHVKSCQVTCCGEFSFVLVVLFYSEQLKWLSAERSWYLKKGLTCWRKKKKQQLWMYSALLFVYSLYTEIIVCHF